MHQVYMHAHNYRCKIQYRNIAIVLVTVCSKMELICDSRDSRFKGVAFPKCDFCPLVLGLI